MCRGRQGKVGLRADSYVRTVPLLHAACLLCGIGLSEKRLKLAQRRSLSVLVQPLSGQQCLTMVFLYLLKAGV